MSPFIADDSHGEPADVASSNLQPALRRITIITIGPCEPLRSGVPPSGFNSLGDLVALQARSPLHLLPFLLVLTLQPPFLGFLGEGEKIISIRILAVALNHGSDTRIL